MTAIHTAPYLIGATLALAIGAMATAAGLDRDRAFYPTVAMVVAAYYVLFAVMGGSGNAIVTETAIAGVFVIVAIAGFRSSLWLAAAALAAHGVFDALHGRFIVNPGVPAWWPAFCATYDVVAAGYLAFLLTRTGRSQARAGAALAPPAPVR